MEAQPDNRHALLRAGAAGQLDSPVSRETLEAALGELEAFVERETRRLLVVEDDEVQRGASPS